MIIRPLPRLHRRCSSPLAFEESSTGFRTTSSLQGSKEKHHVDHNVSSSQDMLPTLSSPLEDALIRKPLSLLTFGIGVTVGISIVLLVLLWKIASNNPKNDDDYNNDDGTTSISTKKDDEEEKKNRSLEGGGGGSRTAVLALYARSQATKCGYGPDDLAPIFLDCLLTTESYPSSVKLIVQICGFLSRLNYYITHRIFEDQIAYFATLGNTGLVAPMHARTCWLDQCVEDFVTQKQQNNNNNNNDSKNVVILGSGFDSRCYRLLTNKGNDLKVKTYEVDAPGTLAAKKKVLQMAGILETTSNVPILVECDFETQDWLQRLKQVGGLDDSLPTLVIWEGVTMYLSPITIQETLQKISRQKSSKWRIAFDYIDKNWAQSDLWMQAMKFVGEPFQFSMTNDEPAKMLQSCNLQLVDSWSSLEKEDNNLLGKRYFPMRAHDQPVGYLGNYGGFVLAESLTKDPQ